MLDQLLRRRVLILLGKGGAGKTTIAAAIASLAARNGPTLAMEADERAPLAALLGSRASYTAISASANLSVMVLEGSHALEEYLRIVIPGAAIFHAVASSRLYQYFVQAAPGLRELMMLGKIYYEAEVGKGGKPHWNTLVFDAPASGHALNLLRMPFAAHQTFGESLVGREAANIGALLRNPDRCALIAVTTPEPLALAEMADTAAELERLQLPLAAVILNRSEPACFTPADLTRLKNSPALRRNPAASQYICAVAADALAGEAKNRRALRHLRARVKSPLLVVGEFRGLSGAALMARLTEELPGDWRRASAAH